MGLVGVVGRVVYALISIVGIIYILFSILAALPLVALAYITLRPISLKLLMQLLCYIQKINLVQLCFIMEKIPTSLNIYFSGDSPVEGESCLIVPNHQNIDWMPLYFMALSQGVLGGVRTVVKKSFQYVPVFGWSMWACYWPFISRDFKKDEKYLKKLFGYYKQVQLPLSLWLFPEGTRITKKKLQESKDYAAKNNYPVFEHVLLPRPKGFHVTLQSLRGVVTHVYDVAIGYKGWSTPPGVLGMISMDPTKKYEVHVHIKRIKIEDMPTEELETKKWLLESFKTKDQLMGNFKKNGSFSQKVSTRKQPLSVYASAFVQVLAMNSFILYSCCAVYNSIF